MKTKLARPLIYGEVLFDRFPDGHAILGGAPFNVAWHLHGLNMSPLMITAVGNDEAGQQILDRMQQWGMDISAVQINEVYPTGQVEVSFKSGEPSYEITTDQAYDHIQANLAITALENIAKGALFYHGSLIERAEESRQTLQQIMSLQEASSFVDINLRPPWWTMEQVTSCLHAATWVKLNEHELATIMDSQVSSDMDLQAVAQQFFGHYGVELLIVTRGGDGAFLVCDDGVVDAAAVNVSNIVDTVGAGDSFSAVMITGMLLEWPMSLRLQRALEFAASICQIQGATSADRSLYSNFIRQWQGE